MSRRKSSKDLARPRLPDDRFSNVAVGQLINMVMMSGKRQLACRIVWGAIDKLRQSEQAKLALQAYESSVAEDATDSDDSNGSVTVSDHADVHALMKIIIEKAGPEVELVSKRLGGANIQAPVAVRANRRSTLAFRSIIRNARSRISQFKSMTAALAQEMIDILKGSAKTLDDKEQTLRMAKANAVFQGVKRGG